MTERESLGFEFRDEVDNAKHLVLVESGECGFEALPCFVFPVLRGDFLDTGVFVERIFTTSGNNDEYAVCSKIFRPAVFLQCPFRGGQRCCEVGPCFCAIDEISTQARTRIFMVGHGTLLSVVIAKDNDAPSVS